VLHSITERFCLRPSFRHADFHFRTYKRDLAILNTEYWQQRIAWWELLNAACQIICIRKQQHRYKLSVFCRTNQSYWFLPSVFPCIRPLYNDPLSNATNDHVLWVKILHIMTIRRLLCELISFCSDLSCRWNCLSCRIRSVYIYVVVYVCK
jgi:hypothetical protein